MIGLNLWTYSQLKSLRINFMLDFSRLVEIIHEAKKVGGIILGGGVPKHHLLISTIFRGGLDSAIQITMDRPESGSSSGAPLEEAISWGKAKNPKMLATIIGDATVLFPVIVGAALDVAKRT
jgi:deoxyhypusine synthase